MKYQSALRGALRYEFAMQARRKALWIGMLFLCTIVFRNFTWFYLDDPRIPSGAAAVIAWSSIIALFFPLGAGLLLADRYTRDRKIRVGELLATAPASELSRLGGKYLGSVLATLLPILLVQLAGTMLIAAHWRDPGVIPLSLGAFAATSVVAVLFVGAFSIACTTVLRPVLYQFLFVGYWFWGNLLNPHVGIPTLNGTLLTPDGRYIRDGLFPVWSRFQQGATLLQGVESLALLLGCAAVALLAAWLYLRWRERRA